ncbi:acyl-CoA dehydrogenase family protein [Cryomorphaceae bacterium]|nr:acyl-CoA dehydrogenase family protein [Cryomorphaceae bacterium]
MSIEVSETRQMIVETLRDFCAREIQPNIMAWDEAQHFPVDVMKKLGELGMLGVLVPQEYGGSGLTYDEYITVVSEIGRVDPSIGLSVAAHNSLCTGHIMYHANEEQKQKWLPKLATGEWIGAWGLTEVGTGSDAGGMLTTAVRDGDDWILNGSKNFITHGKSGDIAVVIVRTGEKGDSHGMTAFAVEKGTPGFSAGRKEDKLGMRASETTELIFENCRVPHENMIGSEGDGFIQAMKVLDGGRISIAALSVGLARGAYEHAVKYSKEREQFGRPIGNFQAIAFKLADMATEIQASELLTYEAGHQKDRGERVTISGAMAKLYASEACVRVANEAVQIHGGYGFTKDFPVEKYYRDCKLCTIGEGTSEIQKVVISKHLLK